MTQQAMIALAMALVVSSAATLVARQSGAKPQTGIPECDKYAAMVTACLPKMCEEERALMEMQLGFALEMLPKQVGLKGRQAAAQSCTRDISEAIKNDDYGCYAPRTAGTIAPKSIQLDTIRPSATSVTLTLSGTGPTTAADTEVIIMTSISEPPTATLPAARMERAVRPGHRVRDCALTRRAAPRIRPSSSSLGRRTAS